MPNTKDTGGSRPRAALFAAAALAALVLFSVAGAVMVTMLRSQAAPSGGPPPGAQEASVAEQAADAQGTPEAAVEAYYAALAHGDYDVARALLTGEAAAGFDPDSLASAGRELAGSEIVSRSVREGSATIVVEEETAGSGGQTSSTRVTFDLVRIEGLWHIGRIARGRQVESSAGPDAEDAEPREGAAAPPSGPVTEERSVEVVGEFLFALQEGRAEQATRYTTRRFREEHPTYAERNSGAFADFEVTSATGSGGAWEVGVKEMWDTGPKEAVYKVVSTPSGPRIDSVVR